MMGKAIPAIILGVLFFAFAMTQGKNKNQAAPVEPSAVEAPAAPDGAFLRLGDQAKTRSNFLIPIWPIQEFDGLPKETILAKRAQNARAASFVSSSYAPSVDVFGLIEDGRPWWGMDGQYFYGPGAQGAEGSSEESRFVLNPLLLVGIAEPVAFITSLRPEQGKGLYPAPKKLVADPSHSAFKAVYNVRDFFAFTAKLGNIGDYQRQLILVAYNARDFGFNYLAVDSARSKNIDAKTGVAQIKQFIHPGPSCGIEGGCNNMSPDQPELSLSVRTLPARANVALWRQQPASASAKPDLWFILEME